MAKKSSAPELLGNAQYVKISDLRLDNQNPRLPERYRDADQRRLAEALDLAFDSLPVAQSIAENGFFASEPLLAIPSPEGKGIFMVVEGNRRLSGLIGLTNPEIRSGFEDTDAWNAAANKSTLTADSTVPVVVHETRDSTHREVASAHVTGKLKWRPYAQSLYIASRIAEGRTFQEVAELLDIPKQKVADMYRDQAVVKQVQAAGLDTEEIESAFSLLTVAMSSTKIRTHVGAPSGAQTVPGEDPIPADKMDELKETIQWVFGTEDHDALITDSRQISQLGNVIATPVGLQSIREGDSLAAAREKVEAAGMNPLDRLVKRLQAAKSALIAAEDDLGEFAQDESVVNLFNDLEAVMEGLRNLSE